jgi:ubiquinone/menaquinone biosynthesis C-methylase UbiE
MLLGFNLNCMPYYDQDLFYASFRGRLLGSLARENEVMRLLSKVQKNESLLEVGCSEGHYLSKLNKQAKRLAGIEVCREKIKEAKKRCPAAELYLIEGSKLPFKAREFDWVLCTEVLEHIPQWKKTLTELKRIAKKNVLLTIPLEKSLWWNTCSKLGFGLKSRGHVHALASKDIEKEMQGFELKEKKFILSPSRHINKWLVDKTKEKHAMYALFFYQRKSG